MQVSTPPLKKNVRESSKDAGKSAKEGKDELLLSEDETASTPGPRRNTGNSSGIPVDDRTYPIIPESVKGDDLLRALPKDGFRLSDRNLFISAHVITKRQRTLRSLST